MKIPNFCLVLLLLAVACDTLVTDTGDVVTDSGVAFLSLQADLTQEASQLAVDQGRIRIEGPTNRLVLVTPGSTETIGGLVPGSYSVTLEGLSNNQVATYGTRSGVNVIAGSTNNVSVTLQSFVPTIQSIPGTVGVGENFEVRFSSVPGATGYAVETANNSSFLNPVSTQSNGTATAVTVSLNSAGSHFVRVRAQNKFGSTGQSSASVAVEVGGSGTVTGTVSAEGAGLSGVEVSLTGPTARNTTTGAGGSYSFTGVPVGSYGVSIDASAHADVAFAQTSKPATLTTNGETAAVDFAGSYIRTATILGTVTADGAPLGGIAVVVTGGPDNITNSSVTNAGGEYSATGLRAGTYTVTITPPAGVTFGATSAVVTVGTGETKTASFPGETVQLASISGVVTIDGVGVAGVELTLSGDAGGQTQTGGGGAYSFINLMPGNYTVTVTPPDGTSFGVLQKSLTLGPGEVGTANFAGIASVATVEVSPLVASIQVGQTVQLTATVRNAFGTVLTGRTVSWSSNNEAAATVSGSGLVMGEGLGVATITASSGGKNGAAVVTVSAIPFDVSPDHRDVGSAAGSTSFTVNTTVGWSVSDDASWLTATKSSGTTIGVNYSANPSTSSRTANITASGTGGVSETVTVTQAGSTPRYTLSVTKSGQGTVTSSPGGISIGTSGTLDSAAFDEETSVTLTATAEDGWQISAWGGACSGVSAGTTQCVVAMNSNQSASVTFGQTPLPDLVPGTFTGPASFVTGDDVGYQVQVMNTGAPMSSIVQFGVDIYLSTDQTISTSDVLIGTLPGGAKLGSGTGVTLSGTVNVPASVSAGNYYIGAIVDPNDWVQESNDSNNADDGGLVAVSPPFYDAEFVNAAILGNSQVGNDVGPRITVRSLANQEGVYTVRLQVEKNELLANPTVYLEDRSITLGAGATGDVMFDWVPAVADDYRFIIEVMNYNATYTYDTVTSVWFEISDPAPSPVAWVVGSGDPGTISEINTQTETVVRTFLGSLDPMAVAFTPSGGTAYVLGMPNYAHVVNPTTGVTTKSIEVGSVPISVAFSPDGLRAYVANRDSNTISVIDVGSEEVTNTIVVGSQPQSVAFSPNGSKAYVVNRGDLTTSVIDVATGMVTNTIPVGHSPSGSLAFSPNGTKVFAVNQSGNISVLDTGSETVTNSIDVGGGVSDVAFTPDGTTAYVSCGTCGDIALIDVATNTVRKRITLGAGEPFWLRWPVAVRPDGGKAYVGSYSSGNISIIDVATETVANTISITGKPSAIAFKPGGG